MYVVLKRMFGGVSVREGSTVWVALLMTCFFVLWNALDITELQNKNRTLQAQVNQLTIEQMQTNQQVRRLWEAQERLLWVSQDIDRRLIEVGR